MMNPQNTFQAVTPAKAGVQNSSVFLDSGACPGPDPGSAGMTDKGDLRLLIRSLIFDF